MTTPPIELRDYWRLWTRDDALHNVAPQRQAVGPQAWDLFVRVGLQYRVLAPSTVDGRKVYAWSDCLPCPLVLEGYSDHAPQGGGEPGEKKG